MTSVPEAFAMPYKHHQGGRLHAAEQIYRQILAVEPNQPQVLHCWACWPIRRASMGGRRCLGRAIGLHGSVAFFHNNLGEAYRALHKMPEAIACYRRALELKPDYAEAHNNWALPADQAKRTRRSPAAAGPWN